ncbi:MAG: sensor histidine kinase [Actinomycetota bacterium]
MNSRQRLATVPRELAFLAAFIASISVEQTIAGPAGEPTFLFSVGIAVWGCCWWESATKHPVRAFAVSGAYAVFGHHGGVAAAAIAGVVLLAEIHVACRFRHLLLERDAGGARSLGFILASNTAGPAAGAAVAAFASLAAGGSPGPEALAIFVPHLLSVFIIIPLFESWRSGVPARPMELVASMLAIGFGLLVMYDQVFISPLIGEMSQYLLLGALGWTAVRLGPPGIALGMLICAVGSPYWTAFGSGPFADLASTIDRSLPAVQVATVLVSLVLQGGSVLIEDLRSTTQELRDTAEDLRVQQEELRQSNAELAQFAYLSSHELQEPLRMLGAYLSLLGERYRGRLDTAADEYIDIAVSSAERLRSLVEDLLGYSQTGGLEPEWRQVDLEHVVDELLGWRSEQIREASANIEVAPLPSVMGDSLLLRLILDNLLSNALRFRAPGGHPSIRIDAVHLADTVVVSVIDDGIGVPEAQHDRVFEPFRRVHPRHRYPGTGLGLTIAATLVRKHGGRIWLEDNPTGGTIARFSIAVAEARPRPAALDHWEKNTGSQDGGRVNGLDVTVAPTPVPPTTA